MSPANSSSCFLINPVSGFLALLSQRFSYLRCHQQHQKRTRFCLFALSPSLITVHLFGYYWLSSLLVVQSLFISCQLMNWWWMTSIMTRELVQCNLCSWFISLACKSESGDARRLLRQRLHGFLVFFFFFLTQFLLRIGLEVFVSNCLHDIDNIPRSSSIRSDLMMFTYYVYIRAYRIKPVRQTNLF